MRKKFLAVAVASVLAAPAAALAQSSVTISGAINIWAESAGATGASNAGSATAGAQSSFDVKPRTRVQDGAGSNIRFTAVEDIGSGMQGFAQVESAVVNNSDTRNDATGTGAVTGGWGTRNTAVGLRGASWGEFLIGVWDVHYNEQYAVDNQLLKGPSHSSVLALMNSFGTAGWAPTGAAAGLGGLGRTVIGARYSNVIRYQSPTWSGFNFKAAYARPTDGVVPTVNGSVNDGTKNTAWNIAPQYSRGPFFVGYSYLRDKDAIANLVGVGASYIGAAGGPGVAGTLYTITSSRLSGAYTFPFGLKLGLVLDSSKLEIKAAAPASGSELKRTVWAVPVSWSSGAHTIFASYARASKLKGSLDGADLGSINITPAGGGAQSIGDSSGAQFYTLGYQFDLSKRTTAHLNYSQIKNDSLAGYDFFSNGVGMANGNFGADPRIYSIGLRHAF
jgi:predicted porin